MLRLWQMMEDDESYVRASSVYLLGALSTVDGVWRDFCKTISFSEVRNVLFNEHDSGIYIAQINKCL